METRRAELDKVKEKLAEDFGELQKRVAELDTDLGAIYRSNLEGLEPRDIVRKIREMESSSLVLGYEEAAEIQRTRQLKVFLNSAPLPENSSSNHALPSHAKDSPKSQEH